MVLPQDFLYVSGDTNHKVGGPFHNFGYFFIFNSFDDIICSNDRQDLNIDVLSTNSFIFADFLRPRRVWG